MSTLKHTHARTHARTHIKTTTSQQLYIFPKIPTSSNTKYVGQLANKHNTHTQRERERERGGGHPHAGS